MHAAAFTNAAVAVRTLLDRGADVYATDAAGLTPLHWAAAADAGAAAEILLARGAGVDAPSADGSTPFSLAVRRHARRVAGALLARGAAALRSDDRRAGELTLSGRVAPVAGIRERVLGASRAGMTAVVPRAPARPRSPRASLRACRAASTCVAPGRDDVLAAVVPDAVGGQGPLEVERTTSPS